MKRYYGLRYADGSTGVFVTGDGNPRPLPPRTDLMNHSPTGLEWGYEGSGPAQLALALLMDVLDDWNRVRPLYQEFKREVVAKWHARREYGLGPDGLMSGKESMPALCEWDIDEAFVRGWVARREFKRDESLIRTMFGPSAENDPEWQHQRQLQATLLAAAAAIFALDCETEETDFGPEFCDRMEELRREFETLAGVCEEKLKRIEAHYRAQEGAR